MKHIIWLLCFNLLFSLSVQAKPLLPEQIPEPLKPWVQWVLQDNPELNCPFIYNSYEQKRCSWPSELGLALKNTGGKFSTRWQVYQDSWVALPGDSKHWPQNVIISNKAALVMDKDGSPSIKLMPGFYQITGEFFWERMPESLSVPADTGLIKLTINDVGFQTPIIKDGQLWLKQSDIGQNKAANEQNKMDLQVFRKVLDDVPLHVLTHLELDVSGEQREAKLALPLLEGFIPLNIQSQLPARLEPDGQLLLQVRPGHWQVEILARTVGELNTIALNHVNNPDWPKSEIWVFAAYPDLRMVEIEQLNAIDASQTNLPEEWKSFPAYAINQGQAMSLKVIRRGDPEPEPSQLSLTRNLWLDFDGTGYTVNDTISGKMTSGWRLNALPETQLGKVTLDGGNQLITQDVSNKQGVEVRKGLLTLNADSRLQGGINRINAVGWEQTFHSVKAELNLPPGWRLLAASGVDNVPDSWLSRWTLLDIFVVLIAALAIGRLWSVSWGIFALITLALIWHEPEAPRFVWLNILAATALLKVMPQNRFFKIMLWYRNAFWMTLILITVPFMVAQVRTGLYPQLEYPWQTITPQTQLSYMAESANIASESAVDMAAPASAPVMQEQAMRKSIPAKPSYDRAEYGSKTSYADDLVRTDPKAKVQTGPGLPQWQWRSVQLSWNGSVDAAQQLRLWYLSPTLTLLLNFIRVALVAILALLMFGVAEKIKLRTNTILPMWLWLLILPALLLPSQKVYAEFPDKELLGELRGKLLEAPDCVPGCAQISNMHIVINEKEMLVTLSVHAQQAVAVPLPAAYEQGFPNQILVDGEHARGLYRDNNSLWLNVSPGEHQLTLRGSQPLLNKFTLPLPLKPHRVSVENGIWKVVGLHENALADDSLQFERVQQTQQEQGKASANSLLMPVFVKINRTLQVGLDWRVLTQITRVSPADAAIVLDVPLLAGESVTTAGIRVKDGKVAVNMPAQESVLQWESTLEKTKQIELKAAETEQWFEVWQVDLSPIWHIEASGIAMMHQNNDQHWLPEWHPWPGEKITFQITRPEAIEGQTLTIDSSHLSIQPGKRAQDVELKISLRSSQGSQHTLMLPEQAVLQSVYIDGQSRAIRQEGRKLTLPINPGKQDITISWQAMTGISSVISTPLVDLGKESVNTNLTINLGQDRWVLFTFGTRFGPAVLFWGVLIVIILLSLALGKITLTPLKHWHWFLLLVGLSQIPIASAVIVVAWLMLLGWRAVKMNESSNFFNGLQLLLGGLTVFSLGLLFFAVAQGLLSSPDMQIAGNQSSAYNLNWYQDRSMVTLPIATVISVPLTTYRLLMLAWSLWMAMSLLNWLKWGWGCFSANGLWHKKVIVKKAEPVK